MARVALQQARAGERRPVYHRLTTSGELVRVQPIEHKGRHYRLTLANGRAFLVDPDHILYTP